MGTETGFDDTGQPGRLLRRRGVPEPGVLRSPIQHSRCYACDESTRTGSPKRACSSKPAAGFSAGPGVGMTVWRIAFNLLSSLHGPGNLSIVIFHRVHPLPDPLF